MPEFAGEPDFLRLLPDEVDVDPNDPRHGNILRLGGLLAALGMSHRDNISEPVMRGGVPRLAGRGIADGRKPPGVMGDAEDREESKKFFRALQEQQVLVFAGRRQVAGGGGISRRGKTTVGGGGGRGGFRSFAYNNYRR